MPRTDQRTGMLSRVDKDPGLHGGLVAMTHMATTSPGATGPAFLMEWTNVAALPEGPCATKTIPKSGSSARGSRCVRTRENTVRPRALSRPRCRHIKPVLQARSLSVVPRSS
jgi:hypothetical protein